MKIISDDNDVQQEQKGKRKSNNKNTNKHLCLNMTLPYTDSPKFLIVGFSLSIDRLERFIDLLARGVTDRDRLDFERLCDDRP